jgi:hypothetical protein
MLFQQLVYKLATSLLRTYFVDKWFWHAMQKLSNMLDICRK